MATDEDYPIDLPILVIEAQIFVAVKKFPFLPDKLIPNQDYTYKTSLVKLKDGVEPPSSVSSSVEVSPVALHEETLKLQLLEPPRSTTPWGEAHALLPLLTPT